MRHAKGIVKVSKSGHPDFSLCIVASDGGSICFISNWPDCKEKAEFIADAFNTTNRTGKTPSQLAEQNKKMLEILKDISERCELLAPSSLKHIKGVVEEAILKFKIKRT